MVLFVRCLNFLYKYVLFPQVRSLTKYGTFLEYQCPLAREFLLDQTTGVNCLK
jgi:hypothetical protein